MVILKRFDPSACAIDMARLESEFLGARTHIGIITEMKCGIVVRMQRKCSMARLESEFLGARTHI